MYSFLHWIKTDRKAARDSDAPLLRKVMGHRSKGPVDGESGLLLYEADIPTTFQKYDKERQVWVESAPGQWVGMWKDYAPRPEHLRVSEKEFLEGWLVELGDGNEWCLPRLQTPTGQSGLPQAVRLSPGGFIVTDPVEKYRSLCEEGRRLWQYLMHTLHGDEKPDVPMTEPEIFRLVSDVVGINYRVGTAEVGLLGLVTTTNFLRIAFGIVGYDLMIEMQKAEERDPGGAEALASG